MAVDIDTRSTSLRLQRARGFFGRLMGLIGRTRMGPDEAFLIEGCSAIHTVGMRMAIDVIFVSRHGLILKVFQRVCPRRFVMCAGASYALELAEGVACELRLSAGMRANLGTACVSFEFAK